MKWFIASDIHGSEYYCKKILDAYKAENADRMLLLGDILYHGPRNNLPKEHNPKAVIDMLNSLKDLTGQTAKSLTIGATNLAKLTNAQKGIATDKNWTLS